MSRYVDFSSTLWPWALCEESTIIPKTIWTTKKYKESFWCQSFNNLKGFSAIGVIFCLVLGQEAIVMQSAGHFCRVSSCYGLTDNKADLFTSPAVKSYCFCLAGRACKPSQLEAADKWSEFGLEHITQTQKWVCMCVHKYTHTNTHICSGVRLIIGIVLWTCSTAEQIYWQL